MGARHGCEGEAAGTVKQVLRLHPLTALPTALLLLPGGKGHIPLVL